MQVDTIVPIIAAIGFGLQQFLQILVDPVASILINFIKNRSVAQPDGTKVLPGSISDVDAKKAILGAVSLVMGLAIASAIKEVRVLEVAGLQSSWDLLITALTISAGTEGTNSIVKLAQYVKDAVKAITMPNVAQNSAGIQEPATLVVPSTPGINQNTLGETNSGREPPGLARHLSAQGSGIADPSL